MRTKPISIVLAILLGAAMLPLCVGIDREDKPEPEPAPRSITITLEATEGSEAARLGRKAIETFAAECPAWAEHWYDVTSAVARYRSLGTSDYLAETYGWTRAIEIEIVLRQGPGTFDEPVPHFAGHTFRYVLGGARNPGIVTSKDGAKDLCGISVTKQGDEMRAVPNLAFL